MEKLSPTNRFKKIRNLVFIMVVGILLITPLIYWFSLNGNWQPSSVWESRNLKAFPALSYRNFKTAVKRLLQGLPTEAGELFFNQFISGDFQRDFTLAAEHQMFQRNSLIFLSKTYKWWMNQIVYTFLPDPAILPAMDSRYYVLRDGEHLIKDTISFGEQQKAEIDLRIANYYQILNDYSDINFYVYNIETLEHSPYHVMAQYFPNADNGQSLNYFLVNKPETLTFRNFAIDSFQDYKERFFRTDHHWKARASIEAYQDIYAMLKDQYEDISPQVEVNEYLEVEDLKFLGSLARGTLYPVTPEPFGYAVVDLGKYETYVNSELTIYADHQSYLDGTYDHSKYFDHYSGFYGRHEIEVHYHFGNDTGRNLLMITSSFARTNQALLASHFDDTYVLDMFFEENRTRSLNQMIKDHGITDVLIMGHPEITYYSTDNIIKP
jgi:hypothetical protein